MRAPGGAPPVRFTAHLGALRAVTPQRAPRAEPPVLALWKYVWNHYTNHRKTHRRKCTSFTDWDLLYKSHLWVFSGRSGSNWKRIKIVPTCLMYVVLQQNFVVSKLLWKRMQASESPTFMFLVSTLYGLPRMLGFFAKFWSNSSFFPLPIFFSLMWKPNNWRWSKHDHFLQKRFVKLLRWSSKREVLLYMYNTVMLLQYRSGFSVVYQFDSRRPSIRPHSRPDTGRSHYTYRPHNDKPCHTAPRISREHSL